MGNEILYDVIFAQTKIEKDIISETSSYRG